MANFTVRVVLGSANGEDYQQLHELMAASGYSREITGDSGKVYILPDAEYDASKDLTTQEVREEVRAIVSQVKQEYTVLVTRAYSRSWFLKVKK